MCEILWYVNVEETIGVSVKKKFLLQNKVIPYGYVKEGHCLLTGQPMSYKELRPPGKMSRSLKNDVFENIISQSHEECLICEDKLPMCIYEAQCADRRQIKEYFCPVCFKYWAILHAKVLGVRFGFIEDKIGKYMQGHIEGINSKSHVQKVDIVASMKRMHRDVIEQARQDLPMPPVPELELAAPGRACADEACLS